MMTVYTGKITVTVGAPTIGAALALIEKALTQGSTRERRGSVAVTSFDAAAETVPGVYRIKATTEVEAFKMAEAGARIAEAVTIGDGAPGTLYAVLVSVDALKAKGRE